MNTPSSPILFGAPAAYFESPQTAGIALLSVPDDLLGYEVCAVRKAYAAVDPDTGGGRSKK